MRSCSLTAFRVAPQSSPSGSSSATGNTVVNQPTVRERSTSSKRSSRPWPSSSTGTVPPAQSRSTRARALSSTSLTCVRYASGTLRSSASVRSALSRRVRVRAEPAVFSPWRSTGSSAAFVVAFSTPVQ